MIKYPNFYILHILLHIMLGELWEHVATESETLSEQEDQLAIAAMVPGMHVTNQKEQ